MRRYCWPSPWSVSRAWRGPTGASSFSTPTSPPPSAAAWTAAIWTPASTLWPSLTPRRGGRATRLPRVRRAARDQLGRALCALGGVHAHLTRLG
jgi:hypothetical protein